MYSSKEMRRRDTQTLPSIPLSEPTCLLSKRKAKLTPIHRERSNTSNNTRKGMYKAEKGAMKLENVIEISESNQRQKLPCLKEQKRKMTSGSRKTKNNDCERKGSRIILPPIKQQSNSSYKGRSAVFQNSKIVLPPIKQ